MQRYISYGESDDSIGLQMGQLKREFGILNDFGCQSIYKVPLHFYGFLRIRRERIQIRNYLFSRILQLFDINLKNYNIY